MCSMVMTLINWVSELRLRVSCVSTHQSACCSVGIHSIKKLKPPAGWEQWRYLRPTRRQHWCMPYLLLALQRCLWWVTKAKSLYYGSCMRVAVTCQDDASNTPASEKWQLEQCCLTPMACHSGQWQSLNVSTSLCSSGQVAAQQGTQLGLCHAAWSKLVMVKPKGLEIQHIA